MPIPQLIVSGSIAVDRIMSFSGKYRELIHPDKLDVLSLSVLIDDLHIANGGVGANISYASAALGDKPILLGSAGHDAQPYLDNLAARGVNVDSVFMSELPTATFTTFTDSENNQVSGFYPGAMNDASTVTLTPWVGQNVFVSVSANGPVNMSRQVAECAEYGMRMFYDPGQQVSNSPADDMQAGVAAAELLAVNEYELDTLCKAIDLTPDALAAKVPLMIVTQGERGSRLSGYKLAKPLQIDSATPTQVIDPTGAGDAYRAGFLYGYLRQWDVTQCAQLASVVASFVLEQPGTQVPLVLPTIMARYQQTYNQEISL